MTERETTQARVDRSTAWVAVASVVLGVLDAVSTILCLRIGVTVAEFGIATLAIALFPIIDRLGGNGLGAAMVREVDTDQAALSSIFWLGIAATMTLLGVMLIAWPLVVSNLENPIIGIVLVAYAGRLVLRHLAIVPEAMMKRDLRYRELSLVGMAGGFAETVAKLGFAYLGTRGARDLAVWCFILGPIANALVTTIGMLYCYPWWPRLAFKREVVARAARFTASVSGGELLYFAYASADYIVVGMYFGDAAVGVYRLAYELVIDIVRMVSLVTTEVAFPTFVRFASDLAAVGALLLRFTRQNLIVLAPCLVYIGIEADDLLALLFGVDSPHAATAARVLCVVGVMRTLAFILPAMLAGIGQPSRVLVYNAVAAIVLPICFVIAALVAPGRGYVAVAWAWAAGYPVAFVALLAMALPLARIPAARYFRAIAGVIGCAAGGAIAGVVARMALPDLMIVRAVTVAPIILVTYGLLLARIERVTIGKVVRSLRSTSPPTTDHGAQ